MKPHRPQVFKNAATIWKGFMHDRRLDSIAGTEETRVKYMRLLFGVIAGALLASIWQLSTINSLEDESVGFRYFFGQWLQPKVKSSVVEILRYTDPKLASASEEHIRRNNSATIATESGLSDITTLIGLLAALEEAHPAAIGIIADKDHSPALLPLELVSFLNHHHNIVFGFDAHNLLKDKANNNNNNNNALLTITSASYEASHRVDFKSSAPGLRPQSKLHGAVPRSGSSASELQAMTCADTFVPRSIGKIALHEIPWSPQPEEDNVPVFYYCLLRTYAAVIGQTIPILPRNAHLMRINFSHTFGTPLPGSEVRTSELRRETQSGTPSPDASTGFASLDGKIVLLAPWGTQKQMIIGGRSIDNLELQAQILASVLDKDALIDQTKDGFPLWLLPAAIILSACYSTARPIPRLVGWLCACTLLSICAEWNFVINHVISQYGSIALMIHCCYLCGTVIYLETETIERNKQIALALQEHAEAERKRIAKDLHDEVLPSLSRIMRLVDRLQDKLPGDATPLEVRQRLEAVVDETRRIVNDLHPVVLDNLGLLAAIEHLALRFAADTGISTICKIDTPAEDFSFSPFVKLSIYRTIQEALNNIDKHAKATSVMVTISSRPEMLTICVTDNGTGLPKQANKRRDASGVLNMAHRAELIGARVQWKSLDNATQGTEVRLEVPLHR